MTWLPEEIRKLDRTPRRAIFGMALAACLLRLFFWAYTGRIWEDALISVLHSENAARGLGFTHVHPGYPPVHGFTSPLSVLVPLAADLFHPGWGLLLLKLVSALAAIPTVLLAAATALNRQVHPRLVLLLCGYLAFEHHQILWGMAGMETQLAVLALFLTMYCTLRRHTAGLGVSLALCLYARPDFAFFVALVGIYLLIEDRPRLVRSGTLAAALYAPWLLFTTWYYGSPVPNTMTAKWLGYPLWIRTVDWSSLRWIDTVWQRVYTNIFLPLGPSFAGHGSGFLPFRDEYLLSRLALLALMVGVLALLRRFQPFYLIPAGFLALYTVYYVFLVHGLFGWYLVPFTALNVFTLVLGMDALFRRYLLPERLPQVSGTVALAYVLPFVLVLPATFRGERDIQRDIENPVRVSIGRYLLQHKQPGDRVGCEPLGYVAYYSRMPVLDYPGLASPEVAAVLKAHPERRSLERMLDYFRPEWILLRENEYRMLTAAPDFRFLQTDYAVEKVFRAARTTGIIHVGHNIDLVFYLLKKHAVAAAAPPGAAPHAP